MRIRRLGRDLLRYAATVQGWGLVLVLTLWHGLVWLPPTLLLAGRWPRWRERFADATHRTLAFYFRHAWYVRVEVEHAERRRAGPRVVVANHQSWLDPLVLMSLEARLAGPVRRYMLGVPLFGRIVRLAGFFQSDIGELPSLDAMDDAVATARARGGSLLFFPEGTRSVGGALGAFHRGAFRTAYDHGLPIQPVVIDGLDRVLPRHGPVVQTDGRYPVRVRWLAPIEPPFGDGLRRDVVRALAARARDAIAAERDAMRKRRDAEEG
jgi:1-acyl-sn-glycerol-3-phosphate acyltransferase